ncbi:uncharacterized protein TNCV_2229051 [Trichonephila clavipes]|nr:uncharacterized protein TNCV_2229051 [Trichonephila clavipes]
MDEQLKALSEGINTLKTLIGNVEKRQVELRKILEKKMEQVEEIYKRVAVNFSLISQRVEDFEKKLLACANATNESKFVPTVPVPVPTSPVRGAAEVLQTLNDTELLNLNSLFKALDLRFGQKFSKDYDRLQMKTRHQKPEEIFRGWAKGRRNLDGCKNDRCQDLKSALLYALKVEAANEASSRDSHSVRKATVTADVHCESPWRKEIENLREEIPDLMTQRQNLRRHRIICCGCDGAGHLRSSCPRINKDDHNIKC